MKLLDILDEELPAIENLTIEEGIFKVSPMIALLAFKDRTMTKIKDKASDMKEKAFDKVGASLSKSETAKAKSLGQSGFKDNDTVYKFTKEQKKIVAYIYNKYGEDIVKKITDFRNEVLAPYQVIKRNVEKSHSLTNREVFGMTKEEYYKYRESGRKKIERRGTYFKDAEDLRGKAISSRQAVDKARKDLEDFKSGKIIDLSATNIEKALTDMNYGSDKLNGWPERELGKTMSEIERVYEFLNDPKREKENFVRTYGRGKSSRYESRDELENYVSQLKVKGASAVNGEPLKGVTGSRRGSFEDALNIYSLRNEVIRDMKKNSQNSDYKKFYIKAIEDSIKSYEKVHKEKLSNYMGLKDTIELNEFEKKIWKKKLMGTYYSGNINDWKLAIKPEDFFDTKYFKKGEKILQAEKEIDAASKRFERELKETMSDEDVALCKKYRLFNNLLTVKQLKNPDNLFKSASELKSLSKEKEGTITLGEFEEALNSSMNKEYNSIKDLEAEQKEIKELYGKLSSVPKETREKYYNFLKRVNPEGNSEITKVSRQKMNDEIDKILDKDYLGKTEAVNDLKRINDLVDDFKKLNGEKEFDQFRHDVSKAREKLEAFIKSREEG